MIETAAVTIVAAVFFGAVLLPAMTRLSFDAPRRPAPAAGSRAPIHPAPAAGLRPPIRPSPRDIRITNGNGVQPALDQAEQKVQSRLARRVALLIERYPERSLVVIRRWLHEVAA
jgi:flagellar biosynthesis/type III secretory pathway M-ring protein FliF/YscJ